MQVAYTSNFFTKWVAFAYVFLICLHTATEKFIDGVDPNEW